jgi:tRNA uridine 5-carboxymethylaminomethyl modification enzyme
VKHRDADVIVVGGGHAGVEAASAARRAGARVVLVTLARQAIGVMSCNPAIGGLGKGHIVREIDALGGVMGRAADAAGIQYRLLNRSRGPAAQAPRAQSDRALYREAVQGEVAGLGVRVVEGEVTDFLIEAGRVSGARLSDGSRISSGAVVLTTGTFLRGVIHIGTKRHFGGRMGDAAAVHLARRIAEFGLPMGRLKTGTPPRLAGRTIAWERVGVQAGDERPAMLSFLSARPLAPQVWCGVTHTNERTHAIIRDALHLSGVHSGAVTATGPRYCPSIEDKVVRFPERASHQIFLEPEGLGVDTVYPNGISTSLPAESQEAYVHSIRGLETARIVRPGYAIEYDYVDPRALDRRLAVRGVGGLFLAGQINGTTGYEEAAGQGVIAGINAAAEACGGEAFFLGRDEAYLGVMIDDLVTRGVTEPYRMFTSRAEYRLNLRADNADQRLTPRAIGAGWVGEERRMAFERKMAALAAARGAADGIVLTPNEAAARGLRVQRDGVRRSVSEILGSSASSPEAVVAAFPELAALERDALEQVAREQRYAPYIARQALDIARTRRDEGILLPERIDYRAIGGLSGELCEKLSNIRPETLAQASRIEGMTPAALTLILMKVRQGLDRSARS